MIKFLDCKSYSVRAMGWVQDASDFDNLQRFISLFVKDSDYFMTVIKRVDDYVSEPLRTEFLDALSQETIVLSYRQIVGTSPSGSRKNSPCTGIGQAAMFGQIRPYLGDWPTDNFLRWSVSLQFVGFNPEKDEFFATDKGERFAKANQDERNKLLISSLMNYAPALFVLEKLSIASEPMTKFEIGQEFGFVGEKGFTSITQRLFSQLYFYADDAQRKKLKSDYEGDSDKYVRQICSWMCKLGLVTRSLKTFYSGENTLKLRAFSISPTGQKMLRDSGIKRTLFVPFGMLSMQDTRVRLRRALILHCLQKSKTDVVGLVTHLSNHGIQTNAAIVLDDIKSLQSIGISITDDSLNGSPDRTYHLACKIIGLEIPAITTEESSTTTETIKDQLRLELKHLDHNLLVLIDYAFGGRDTSRKFEVYIAKAYEQIFENVFLMGGVNKPDIVVCHGAANIIIDAKAYSEGFALPKAEQDKMVRYIEEFQEGDAAWVASIMPVMNPNAVPAFQFCSSKFINPEAKLKDIAKRRGVNGCAISAINLLRYIDFVLDKQDLLLDYLTSNSEVNYLELS